MDKFQLAELGNTDNTTLLSHPLFATQIIFCKLQILKRTPPKEADHERSRQKSDFSLEHGAASQRTEANDMRLQKQVQGC